MFDGIEVVGAREHNLKSVSVQIPRKKITVITGLSGSGKSSLAFDTIYAEGQRRYIEGLSVYARQFLDQLKKPDVDAITGLSPAIAIDQKSISTNPRSTVGTVTEIFDYFRLLFANAGVSRCPQHGIEVASQSPESIVQDVMTLKPGTRFFVLAAMARGKKGEFQAEFLKWIKKGFTTVRVDGDFFELAQLDKLAKSKPHNIDLVVDRLVAKPGIELRLAESINSALALASGRVLIEEQGSTQQKLYSISAACPVCGYSFPELEPRLFSFNNPKGACQTCNGLGTLDIQEFEQEVLVPSAEGMKRIKQTRYEDDGDEDSEESVQRVRPCPDCQGHSP